MFVDGNWRNEFVCSKWVNVHEDAVTGNFKFVQM
jgi:sarcosine oxidase delta subunit